jgi:hypothetical protein
MDRKTGYMANIENIPPLIFRFQFNPELLTDKKSFKYEQANSFGQWGFDQTAAGSGVIGALTGLWNDVKEISSLLVATKPLEAKEGELRTIGLEFKLDASLPGPLDGDSHYGGSIKPDLAILRSFMYPSWDLIDVGKMVIQKKVPCWKTPPEVSLSYGGISATCVMTDLNIKIMAFKDNGDPLRAEVDVTLKEQTYSASPIVEFALRTVDVAKSFDRKGIGTDILAVTPVVNLFV